MHWRSLTGFGASVTVNGLNSLAFGLTLFGDFQPGHAEQVDRHILVEPMSEVHGAID
jgi:hypothetical protein